MRKTTILHRLSLLLCLVLIAATVFIASGCAGQQQTSEPAVSEPATSVATATPVVKGEGKTVFSFIATDKDGKSDFFEIHTDEKTVGAALLKVGLIEGTDSEFGLYVKKVNGITADYDKDGTYWAFYINGTYASSGVDATEITEGATYEFKVE